MIEANGPIDPNNEFDLDWLDNDLALCKADREAVLFAQTYRDAAHALSSTRPTVANTVATLPVLGDRSRPAVASGSDEHTQDERVERATERFIDHKRKATNDATSDKYASQCRMFLKIVARGRTELPLSAVSADDIRF